MSEAALESMLTSLKSDLVFADRKIMELGRENGRLRADLADAQRVIATVEELCDEALKDPPVRNSRGQQVVYAGHEVVYVGDLRAALSAGGTDPNRDGRLREHIIAVHRNEAGASLTPTDAVQYHRHEHLGPGGIRNHVEPADLHREFAIGGTDPTGDNDARG